MKKITLLISTLLVAVLTLGGCGAVETETAQTAETENTQAAETQQSYVTITGDEAKEMMDADDSVIILDVRSQEEYDEGHIQDAILIPDTDILEKAEELLPDQDATILVYCRSGRRSALAAADLAKLGYTGIYDFGGIIDWKYEVVAE